MCSYFMVDSELASFGMVLNEALSFFFLQYDWVSN